MIRVFKQYIPKAFLVLGGVEFFVAMAAAYVGVGLRFLTTDDALESSLKGVWPNALLLGLVLTLSMAAMGLYQRRFRHGIAGMLLRLFSAFVVAGVMTFGVYYLFPSLLLGRGAVVLSFVSAFCLLAVIRTVFMKTVDQDLLKRRVLVLGAGEKANQIRTRLRRKVDQRGYLVVGFIHVRGEHDVVEEQYVVRPDMPLLELVQETQADEIVVAVGERRKTGFPVHELLDCKLSGVDVIDLPTFFEREVGKIKLDTVSPSWLIFSDGFRSGDLQVHQKRAFDILVSLVLLLLAWPFMVLVALAIKLEEGLRAPVIYRQVRVGQNWRLFNVYKFRSMRTDAEKSGKAQWAQRNDSRVTRVGGFIRKVRLDELPQIVNVLKGDMSFVGPRPERPEFVTRLSDEIPYYAERHRVKPGITGWAQVCYPYGASDKDSAEKLEYDLYYIKNYSLFLDLVIILQTAHEVLWGKGGR